MEDIANILKIRMDFFPTTLLYSRDNINLLLNIFESDNNIHPAIYSYIAYRNGETLRTKYNGETPNADPRKWEMASNMLYKTGNPVMLRALVGEDVCRDFIKFCKIRVITIDDVINNRYDINFITNMDSSEKYATVLGLSQVKEDNFRIVRDFIKLLGSEFLTTFDNIWTRNDLFC